MAGEAPNSERVVVCGMHGHPHDATAVEAAVQLAVVTKAALALVAVAPSPDRRAAAATSDTWAADEARRALELTAQALEGRVPVACHVEHGNPVRGLVEFAQRKRALMLVVGLGTGGNRSASMVAGGVARSATCPVVVVPAAAESLRLEPSSGAD